MKLPPGHVAGANGIEPGKVVLPTGYGGFGERLLRGMGWDKGQGLGLNGAGIKEAIQVKKKEDTLGVGGKAGYAWGDKWWERAFDTALLQTMDNSDSDSSGSDSDEGAAATNRDGTLTSASAAELKLTRSLAQGSRLVAGRFGGRDAKMERIRAQEAKQAAEAAAKLGGVAAVASPASEEKKASKKRRKEGGAEGEETPRKKKGAGRRKSSGGEEEASGSDSDAAEAAPAAKKRIVIEPKVVDAGPKHDFKPTPKTGWWGAALFMSAGCMEGLTEKKKRAVRETFDEDLQTEIYMAAHNKKTQGKVGLGQGTGTMKVGGVKWAGSKVSFEEEEQQQAGAAPAAAAAAAAEDDADGKAPPAAAGAAGEASWHASIKWKKVITAALRQAPDGRLKLVELHRSVTVTVKERVAASGGGGTGQKVRKAEVKRILETTIESSSKFVLEGKLVQLKA